MDEFNYHVSKFMERNVIPPGFVDLDEKHNISLTILDKQWFDIYNLNCDKELLYSFTYSIGNVPIKYSSHNKVQNFTKCYDFKSNTSEAIKDWNSIFKEWIDIKKTTDYDYAMKKLQMLIKVNEISQDFS